ncbi:alpha/beta hydrolase family protein [Mycolicibacterium sp. A43C]
MTLQGPDGIAGISHEPATTPAGIVLLTHGAGGNRDAALLVGLCDEWARQGYLAIRYNLPYRRRRPKGPPSNSAASDQAGIAEAIAWARTQTDGPVIAGGHSYGGRMTSMVAASAKGERSDGGKAQGERSDGGKYLSERPDLLTLSSYPLHPPGKPERSRTEHLPDITVPTVFTHGTADPFGTIAELRAAADLVAGPTRIVEVTGARHDLRSTTSDVPALAVAAAAIFLS